MSELSSDNQNAEAAGQTAIEQNQPPGTRTLLRRLGCGLILAFWFVVLLTPCGLFYLATNGEIRLEHADIPQPHAHPRLLISLISEKDERGLRIESSTIDKGSSDTAICIETSVRFLLWESSGGDQNTQFCDCYHSPDGTDSWGLAETFSHACPYND